MHKRLVGFPVILFEKAKAEPTVSSPRHTKMAMFLCISEQVEKLFL